MKYLRKFATEAEYNAFKGGDDYVTPNLSLVSGLMNYNSIEYPLYIEALGDLTISFSTTHEYSKDNIVWTSGKWSSLHSVKAGEKIYFRASINNPSSSFGIGSFTISGGNCNVGGNVMSMAYGADFKGNVSLKNYQFHKLFENCTIVDAGSLLLPAATLTEKCYSYMFSGCKSLVSAPALPATTLANYCYYYMFKDCSSLVNAPKLPATTLAKSCYNSMFYGTNILPDCSNIDFTSDSNVSSEAFAGLFAGTKIKDIDLAKILPTNSNGKYYLPATTLANNCYSYMFYDCKSLVTAPELPATTLANNCYSYMFRGCTSLVNAPATLPATTLANNCYYYMFFDCRSLVDAPELPAATLTEKCYSSMFYDCKSLVNAPELPATTLAKSCYYDMFHGCTSLVSAPALPATTLAEDCYDSMLSGCTSLVNAPELPATTLANNCYSYMFRGCTSLVNAPELPATTLVDRCYYNMFSGCTSLVNAPATLPATTLANNCYYYMFDGCTSLVNAPALPATTLVSNCYSGMFRGCAKLDYIKMLATDVSASNCLKGWVNGVASVGTFVKSFVANWDVTGPNGVPEGWELKYDFTPVECTSLTISAEDVSARATSTKITYTAVINGYDANDVPKGVTITRTVQSEEFPQNTSYTDVVEREISFTFMGVTATTIITQDVWLDKTYIIDLNSNWQLSSDIANPDSATYDGVYESFSNKGVDSKAAIMYIDIVGYETFQLYIRSYAESSYDYVMVSQLDQTIDNNTSYIDSTLVKDYTRGSQSSGTAIGSYKPVEFTGIDEGEHRITIVYRKDSGGASGADRGYVLIPKNQ